MALGGTFEPALIRSRGLAALLHKLTIGLRALGTAVIGAASELGQVMPHSCSGLVVGRALSGLKLRP